MSRIPQTEPAPELWLHRVIEDESVGGMLSPNDRYTLVAIARLSFKVRTLQREFFKNRSFEVLDESKKAERELDKLLSTPAKGELL